jgi:integrase
MPIPYGNVPLTCLKCLLLFTVKKKEVVMNKFYYSVYGPLIETFIDLKKRLGYTYTGGSLQLARFDKLAAAREETIVGITKELAEQWGTKNPNESDPNRYIRIEIIRQFSLFLCQQGYPSHVARLPRFNSQYTPYIFSNEQIRNLFLACDRLQHSPCQSRSTLFIVPALFRLLYGTGMRISEALSLLAMDVHLPEKYLLLRRCKNGKDRLIPLSDSLVDVCKGYLPYRDHYARLNPSSSYFFIGPGGKPCQIQSAYCWFRKILYQAGIPHQGKGLGPRLHDFRHTFSVHSLARMAETGLDLYYSLPLLSTYLGHQTLEATEKYVRLTKDMYPSILENVNKLYPFLFPHLAKSNDHETY